MPALFVQDLKMGTRFEDFNGDPGGGLSDNMKTMIMIHDFYRKGEISTQLTVK